MSYILKQDVKTMLDLMEAFPDHDAFLVDIDSSNGIGTNITLTVDVIYNGVPGKFTMTVNSPESW